MVWAFKKPHRVGSVCRTPCQQCGPGDWTITHGTNGEDLPSDIPFYIVAPATEEQWLADGGAGRGWQHFYFVTTD